MASLQVSFNKSDSQVLTSLTEYLFVSIPVPDSKKQIIITHLNYGYTVTAAADRTNFGYGAIHVIQGQPFVDSQLGYFPDKAARVMGDEIYLDITRQDGDKPIDFADGLRCDPSQSVIVVVSPAIQLGGIIVANQTVNLTVKGYYKDLSTDDRLSKTIRFR